MIVHCTQHNTEHLQKAVSVSMVDYNAFVRIAEGTFDRILMSARPVLSVITVYVFPRELCSFMGRFEF